MDVDSDKFLSNSSLISIYVVTKEEPVWESFSEDEPVAPRDMKPASSAGKGKKANVKAGQGNIMSFFGKK